MNQTISSGQHITGMGLSKQACRRRQTAAVVFIVLSLLVSLLRCFGITEFLAGLIESGELSRKLSEFNLNSNPYVISNTFVGVIKIISDILAFSLLVKCSPNKAVKTSLLIIICATILSFVLNFLHCVINYYTNPVQILLSVIENAQLILNLYALTVLIRNISFEDRNLRFWVSVLPLYFISFPVSVLFFKVDLTDGYEFEFVFSSIYFILDIVMTVLYYITYIKLFLSDNFSGKHIKEAAKPYTPFNKYFAGWLIGIAVTIGALALYYTFAAEPINRIFN